jgi:AraC family transcriptional regulator
MNCFEETEFIIDYIENNIYDVNIANISKLTGVPCGFYQRIFSYVCGISFSEYLRKRKLSIAGYEILNNKDNVINIAIKSGYDSHSSFTRAFKEQFGVPPTCLTNDIYQARAYKCFSFHGNDETYYVMKGKRIMADLVKIEYTEIDERMLIGISMAESGVKEVPELWKAYFEGGFSEQLGKLEEYQCDDMTEDYMGIGYATDFIDDKSLGSEYVVGRYFKHGTPIPENMVYRIIPKGTIVKAQIKGKNLDDIIYNSYILINDMVQKNGYKLDYNNFYWSEVYTYERYCNPADNGADDLILDWYMPCIKESVPDRKKNDKIVKPSNS